MKNFMKKLNKVMIVVSWTYLAMISGCYIGLCLMDGIIDVWNASTCLDEYGTVIVVIAGAILTINYPIPAIGKLISDSWNELKEDREAKKKAKEEKRNEVPIVTFDD